jgi:hypothetical protein
LNAAVLAWLAGVTIIALSIASIDHSSSSTGWPTGVSYFFGSLRRRGTSFANADDASAWSNIAANIPSTISREQATVAA